MVMPVGALDTANTGRVADYMRSQSGAQYIVVSHKPQMYERAGCLVGVYSQGHTSSAVTLRLPLMAAVAGCSVGSCMYKTGVLVPACL